MSRDSLVLGGVLGAALAAATVGLAGCASHAHTNAGALHNLNECPLVAVENTGGWQQTDVGGGFSVRLRPTAPSTGRCPEPHAAGAAARSRSTWREGSGARRRSARAAPPAERPWATFRSRSSRTERTRRRAGSPGTSTGTATARTRS